MNGKWKWVVLSVIEKWEAIKRLIQRWVNKTSDLGVGGDCRRLEMKLVRNWKVGVPSSNQTKKKVENQWKNEHKKSSEGLCVVKAS